MKQMGGRVVGPNLAAAFVIDGQDDRIACGNGSLFDQGKVNKDIGYFFRIAHRS